MKKVKLGELVNIKTGKLDANAAVDNGKYPFFTTAKEISWIDEYAYEDEVVLLAGNGDLNVKYYKGKFNAYQRTYILTAKASLDMKYLFYFLDKYVEVLRKQSIGGVIKYIKLSNLTMALFPQRNLKQQEKIVTTLDKLNELIIKRKNQLLELDNLVKSRFVKMFGDISELPSNPTILGEVSNIGSSHRVFTKEFVETGVPFYRGTEIGELSNGRIPENPYYISKEHYERLISGEKNLSKGDLLLPSICNKGQIWLVNTDEPFYYKDGRVLYISPDRELFNPVYFHFYMKEKTLFEYPKLGSGSTFAEFKIFILKELTINLPPLALQNEFADFVEEIDKSKLAVKQSLEELETLKKKLMQDYFG